MVHLVVYNLNKLYTKIKFCDIILRNKEKGERFRLMFAQDLIRIIERGNKNGKEKS